MADGSYKPISAIVVGDMVMAHDPETGVKGAREVTHVWVHQDALVNLEIDGETVTTTSDHPFWNATDAQWQDAGVLDAGDMVLTSTGDFIPVAGLLQNSWHIGTAYNLTVDDIHTYYVQAADADVLVHNCNWVGTSMDDVTSKIYHWKKHGVPENVTYNQYLDDGLSWAKRVPDPSVGAPVPLRDGSTGFRIRTPGGGPGGILTSNGDVVSFWYH